MIYIGTCSWTDKALIKNSLFYPDSADNAEARIRFYASKFNTVEVDSTYYAIPDRKTSFLWAQRTPESFVFHIKAYGALTGHGINPKTLPRDLSDFLSSEDKEKKYIYIKEPHILKAIAQKFTDSINPLQIGNKLGVVIFQYPPWFHYSTSNIDFILTSKELMKDIPVAVEFRHGSWLKTERRDEIFSFLEGHNLIYIAADEPQYGNLATVPFVAEATGNTAYFRFHGRNKENWLKKGVETSLRYDYLYSDDELKGFLEPALNLSKKAKKVYLMFNNCHGGYAFKNALKMEEIIFKESSD